MFSPVAHHTAAPLTLTSCAQRWLHQCDAHSLVCLHLSAHDSQLEIYTQQLAEEAPMTAPLSLGLDLLVRQVFAGKMPNEAQLEHGIMLVEDAIMPLAALVPADSVLLLNDPILRKVGLSALGNARTHTKLLRREAIETLFNLLTMQAAHPQVPLRDVPQSPEAAAGLLILREVLHHWQVQTMLLDHQPNG